jgi:hypothetical protein
LIAPGAQAGSGNGCPLSLPMWHVSGCATGAWGSSLASAPVASPAVVAEDNPVLSPELAAGWQAVTATATRAPRRAGGSEVIMDRVW